MTRREALLLGLAAAALPARAEKPATRKTPSVCVLSTALAGVGYAEMGDIVKQIGFDGVDITVMAGGLVEPALAPVDEVRALESIHGADLETPVITTALATPYDAWTRTVLALAGRTGVPLFKCGLDQRNASPQTRRDATFLSALGHEYKIALTVVAGCRDMHYDIPTVRRLVSGMDPAWSGICLRSDCPAAAVSDDQLRSTLPLVRAVSLADYGDGPTPLGKGSVDFGRLFKALAQAGFVGPVTVERDYKTGDGPGALSRDLEFVRKQIRTSYGAGDSAT